MNFQSLILACSDVARAARFVAGMPPSIPIVNVETCALAGALKLRGTIACVIDAALVTSAVSAQIAHAKTEGPLAPIVLLVSGRTPDTDLPAWADSFLSLDRPPGQLWPAIRRATIEARLIEVVSCMRRRVRNEFMSKALFAALTAVVPFTSVEELADHLQCSSRTLYARWRMVFGEHPNVSLADFVNWILLVRTLERKGPHCAWSSAFSPARTSTRRLQRISRRLVSAELAVLDNTEPLRLMVAFTDLCQLAFG